MARRRRRRRRRCSTAATSATWSRSRRCARSRRSRPSGGDLDELLSQLVALRLTENPEGIDEAEDAVRALQQTIGTPPHLATPARLDEIGAATRRLEQALDPAAPSPFTAALKGAQGDDRRAAEGGRGSLPRAALAVTDRVRRERHGRYGTLRHGRRWLLSVGR